MNGGKGEEKPAGSTTLTRARSDDGKQARQVFLANLPRFLVYS